jgi:hypothetical protein
MRGYQPTETLDTSNPTQGESKTGKQTKSTTTEEHFELFKLECAIWLDIFGLKGWKIEYLHDGADNTKERDLAWTSCHTVGRVATIGLQKDWLSTEPTEYRIRQTAFHEVCEVLLDRLETIANTRIIGPDEIREETHNIIRILENVVWKPTIE